MSVFEQSRYYFNNVLPEIIISNIIQINNFLALYWWVFLFICIIIFVFLLKNFRKIFILKNQNEAFNLFLKELSLKINMQDIENQLVNAHKLVDAKYSAVYELRGETYILIESSIAKEGGDVNIPLRVGRESLKTFNKSGNYMITGIMNSSQNNLMLLYSKSKLDFQSHYGYFDIMLSYYEQVSSKFKIEGGETQSNISKNTSLSLMKLQMDKKQFFKFFIALVLKITKAQGAKLFTKSDEVVFEHILNKNLTLQKIFYIRNTPYKLEFYDTKVLDMDTIVQVGSFLDMAGAFLMNIDQNSEMVQNYLSFLKFTNKAIELENKYYEHHSLIVQMISVELAKSLFLSEEEIDTISVGSYLHDIGMIGDLLSVINKEEFEEKDMNLIKEHPLIGSVIVEPICHIYSIENIIKYHHERFDGKGYPFGIKESQIPLDAQIVSVGEFYAGITSDRSYKKGKTHEEAVKEMKNLKGKMFNSVVVDAFLDVEKSIKIKIDKIKMRKNNDKK